MSKSKKILNQSQYSYSGFLDLELQSGYKKGDKIISSSDVAFKVLNSTIGESIDNYLVKFTNEYEELPELEKLYTIQYTKYYFYNDILSYFDNSLLKQLSLIKEKMKKDSSGRAHDIYDKITLLNSLGDLYVNSYTENGLYDFSNPVNNVDEANTTIGEYFSVYRNKIVNKNNTSILFQGRDCEALFEELKGYAVSIKNSSSLTLLKDKYLNGLFYDAWSSTIIFFNNGLEYNDKWFCGIYCSKNAEHFSLYYNNIKDSLYEDSGYSFSSGEGCIPHVVMERNEDIVEDTVQIQEMIFYPEKYKSLRIYE